MNEIDKAMANLQSAVDNAVWTDSDYIDNFPIKTENLQTVIQALQQPTDEAVREAIAELSKKEYVTYISEDGKKDVLFIPGLVKKETRSTAITSLRQMQPEPWISVSDPPKEAGYYLVANGKDVVKTYYAKIPGVWVSIDDILNPTHWMPLPEPPNCGRALKEGE
jgi:hypothetical protein